MEAVDSISLMRTYWMYNGQHTSTVAELREYYLLPRPAVSPFRMGTIKQARTVYLPQFSRTILPSESTVNFIVAVKEHANRHALLEVWTYLNSRKAYSVARTASWLQWQWDHDRSCKTLMLVIKRKRQDGQRQPLSKCAQKLSKWQQQ